MAEPADLGLAETLMQAIASGRYPVGSLLPTEFELCDQYGASRYKVRLALQSLQEMGLISRRKNLGTRVEADRPAEGFTQSVATVEQLGQFGAEHKRVLRQVGEVVVDGALARDLGCEAGSRWLRISSMRMHSGRNSLPMGWTDVYVDPAYAEIATMVVDAPDVLVSSLIERRFGRRIARIQQAVDAVTLAEPHAGELRADVGSAALRIVRHYLDSNQEAFEISMSLHPAGRFRFASELKRASA